MAGVPGALYTSHHTRSSALRAFEHARRQRRVRVVAPGMDYGEDGVIELTDTESDGN